MRNHFDKPPHHGGNWFFPFETILDTHGHHQLWPNKDNAINIPF